MKKTLATFALMTLVLVGCKEDKNSEKENMPETAVIENTETMPDEKGEWVTLFDGKNMDGWHAYNGDKSTQWSVEDGALVLKPSENRSGSENLVTDGEYTDFELSLEWKISEGGNSGVIWAVQEGEQWGEPYLTGPEIQVLDNERHPDAKAGKSHQSGALYDMIPPSADVAKPAGEWNNMTFIINHKENMGSVDLNGERIVEFPVEGEKWDEMVAKSKFGDWKDFAKEKTGHIALQDHGNSVSFRNIKIKEL